MKTAITPTRADNYPEWYQQIIKSADMAEMSGVRGCMVIKPWGYGIWERIQRHLDDAIKATGHDNCYFPLFIPLSYLQKEADHVDGFAKEMAVVTHHRLINKNGQLVPDPASALDEPLVIRPTSETIIGEAMAKWVQSYRDLPVLINQWANVVRWEMRPRIFLRTAEFLWQEGHTAHADKDDAVIETKKMLEVYRVLVEEFMAIPVIQGEKSPGERFPGAVDTYCIEAMMQDGRALQAGTSHYLGENFAKAANIQYTNKAGDITLCHTTSWGVSTRLIGAVIMTHSDDDGLQLPPRLAPQQIVIVPILRDEAENAAVLDYAEKLAAQLQQVFYADEKLRVKIDRRDMAGSDKRWQWIKKGVPLVLEVGPKDIAANAVAVTRRDKLADKKEFPSVPDFIASVPTTLAAMQDGLFQRALQYRAARTKTDIGSWDDFAAYFSGADDNAFSSSVGFVQAKWCSIEDADSMEKLKKLGVTIRCLPLVQSGSTGTCVLTGQPATLDAIFAKAY